MISRSRGVKRLVVGKVAIEVEPSTKRIARAMLSRMSSNASRSTSESIDRVGGHMRPEARLQGFPVDHIHGSLKQAGDISLQARIVEHGGNDLRVEVYQNVDVAFGSLLVPRGGTEQRGMRHAVRLELGLALPQAGDDGLSVHVWTIPQTALRDREIACHFGLDSCKTGIPALRVTPPADRFVPAVPRSSVRGARSHL